MRSKKILLERARHFDKEALAEVNDQYSPGIYRYAMRLLGDANQAEDCVSETFSRYLTGLQSGLYESSKR
jgi:RNA polymerase sigma-70 factor (ECF subfamily)